MLLDKNDLWVPGLSKGKLGIWKYDPQFVYDIGRILDQNILTEMVDIYMVKGIDAFLQEYPHVLDFEVDPEDSHQTSSQCVIV